MVIIYPQIIFLLHFLSSWNSIYIYICLLQVFCNSLKLCSFFSLIYVFKSTKLKFCSISNLLLISYSVIFISDNVLSISDSSSCLQNQLNSFMNYIFLLHRIIFWMLPYFFKYCYSLFMNVLNVIWSNLIILNLTFNLFRVVQSR